MDDGQIYVFFYLYLRKIKSLVYIFFIINADPQQYQTTNISLIRLQGVTAILWKPKLRVNLPKLTKALFILTTS